MPNHFTLQTFLSTAAPTTSIAAPKGISSPIFRRELSVDASIRRARVYISGLGYYELSINGKKVGDVAARKAMPRGHQ
jgi:Alpha-L-rhamnosidase N-terminal domain